MAPSLILHRRPQVPAEESAVFGPVAERFRRAGDLERAVSLCRDGLQKFPHHISGRVTLGWALLDLGKYDDARTELEIVLRRAPDNLAAIRGLAELHDRSEHTLHLPMDGPGQWPPDEAAVNQAAAEPVIFTLAEAPVPEPEAAEETPAVFTRAELGMAIWSSAPHTEPVASPEVAVELAETPVAPIGDFVTLVAPIEDDAAVPAAWFEPAAASVESVEDVAAAASVEQPLAPATASEPAVPAVAWLEPPMASPEISRGVSVEADVMETPVVLEADIAALIAEADKLEAAAESTAPEAALVLDAGVEMDSLHDVGLELSAPGLYAVEAVAPAEAEVGAEVGVEAEVEAEVEATVGAEVEVEVAALAIQGVAHAHIAEVASMDSEANTERLRSPVAAMDSLHDVGLELSAPGLYAVEAVAPAGPEVRAEVGVEAEVEAEVEAQVEAEVEAAVEAAVEVEVAALAAQGVAHAHIAEVVSMARVANTERLRSPVATLEGFLHKVQARRSELMTESVA